MFLGSTLGGYVPTFWDASLFSMSGLVGSTVGAALGIWAGYTLSRRY